MNTSDRRHYTFKAWLQYFFWSGYGKAILAIVVAAAVSALFYWYFGSNDPFFAREFGNGWECSELGHGARFCAKDAPLPAHHKRP